jgi:hypothetical protein
MFRGRLCWTFPLFYGMFKINNFSEAGTVAVIRCKGYEVKILNNNVKRCGRKWSWSNLVSLAWRDWGKLRNDLRIIGCLHRGCAPLGCRSRIYRLSRLDRYFNIRASGRYSNYCALKVRARYKPRILSSAHLCSPCRRVVCVSQLGKFRRLHPLATPTAVWDPCTTHTII